MSHRRFWHATRGQPPVATPPAAEAFYRHPRWKSLALAAALACSLAPTPLQLQLALIDNIFADHKRRYRHREESTDVWGNAVEISRWLAGTWLRLFFGDCDDFAVMLLMALVRAALPRGACRLAQVKAPQRGVLRGHLVLVIATEDGSLVCDSLQPRPLWGDDPAFDGYELVAIEDPPARPGAPARWVSLKVNTLADLMKGRTDMHYSASDIEVLARTIYGEARGEGWAGKVAVAHVVLNRAIKRDTSPAREAQRPWQFSAWNENDPNRAKILEVTPESDAFRECLAAAAAVLGGVEPDPTVGSLHYHTAAVKPSWSRGKEPVVVIGRHLFFNDID